MTNYGPGADWQLSDRRARTAELQQATHLAPSISALVLAG